MLENEVAHETDLTAFSFSGKDQHKQYLFSSEMAGYKYIEDHIDKSTGRQLQVEHATNLLRDKLLQQYGAPVDYKNPQIYATAKAGIDQIYQDFKIASTPPTNVADFMGELRTNPPNNKSTNNNSWRLWEDAIQNGDMFDIETEPNVWSWVHGEWDCNITYAAMSLDWNYRQNGQTWNDCISSYCLRYQPGADAMCFGMYKDGFLQQGLCKKYVYYIYSSDWYNGLVVPCQNDLTGLHFGSFLCSNLHDDISSLRMQVVWEGCPVSFHDF